jgi:hypothetical protein
MTTLTLHRVILDANGYRITPMVGQGPETLTHTASDRTEVYGTYEVPDNVTIGQTRSGEDMIWHGGTACYAIITNDGQNVALVPALAPDDIAAWTWLRKVS